MLAHRAEIALEATGREAAHRFPTCPIIPRDRPRVKSSSPRRPGRQLVSGCPVLRAPGVLLPPFSARHGEGRTAAGNRSIETCRSAAVSPGRQSRRRMGGPGPAGLASAPPLGRREGQVQGDATRLPGCSGS
jgi:hypothetical protein